MSDGMTTANDEKSANIDPTGITYIGLARHTTGSTRACSMEGYRVA
jgi:hypothetical protein